jgi:tetratricopeptide (TPR) repeat protein
VFGDMPEAERCLTRAEELARNHEQLAGLVEATTVRCGICTFTADFESAAKHLAEAASLGREIEDLDTTAFGLAHRANMLTHLARFDEAYETAQEGLLVAEEAQNLERRADLTSYSIPFYHLHKGELAEAYKWAEESYSTATRIGAPIPAVVATYILGMVSELRGKYEVALEWHRRGLDIARPIHDFLPFMLVLPLGGLGAICLDISEDLKDMALEYHTEALGLLNTPLGAAGGGTGWADLGFCVLALGYPDLAYERFQNGLTTPSMQMYLQRPKLLAGAALAAQALGKSEEAAQHIEEARRYSEENGFKWFNPLVDLADGQVSAARGESERALDSYRRATALAKEMDMPHVTWQAQAGAARILRECGHASEAAALQSSAHQTLTTLATLFKQDSYREAFEQSINKKIPA